MSTHEWSEWDEDELPCPHCGEMIGDLWDYHIADNDIAETQCPHCDAEIELTQETTINYCVRKKGET